MAESEEKTETFNMRVSPAFLRMIDEWRRQQTDLPSRAEAIRRLVVLGLLPWQDIIEQLKDTLETARSEGRVPTEEDVDEIGTALINFETQELDPLAEQAGIARNAIRLTF